MKLSTKGRYGSRAMLDIAIHYDESPIAIKAVAQRQGISERYLENIMTILVSHGFVNSIRGNQGGFILAHPPKGIKLGDIIQVLEGTMAIADCVEEPSRCERAAECVTQEIWCRVKLAMMQVLDSFTLQDMVDIYHKKTARDMEYTYYI